MCFTIRSYFIKISSGVFMFALTTGFLYSKTLDSMNTIWSLCTDGVSSGTVSVSENANVINYDFSNGEWVCIYNESFNKLNFSSADSIKFHFKGNTNNRENHLKVQIYDHVGNIFDRKISSMTPVPDWTEIILPFSSFSHWAGTGNGILDTSKIKKIEFVVAPGRGGSGNITIDEIKAYKLNTPEFMLVSGFNFGTPPNELGGNEGPMSPDNNGDGIGDYNPEVFYDKDNSYEGQYCLKLTYDDFPSGQWCGYWINLSSAGDKSFRDLSSYTHLKFYVKSDVIGKDFKVELKDNRTTFPVPSVYLTSILPAGTSTQWQEVSIPISAFTPAVFSTTVAQVNFVFDVAPRSGVVYIDNIRFTSAGTYTGGVVSDIDNMESLYSLSGWENYGKDEDKNITTTSLENVSGYSGNAIRLNYKFNRIPVSIDDWVVMVREWGANITEYNAIKFKYKGSGGNNNLEVKIEDNNGTVFCKKLYNITNTEGVWKEITVPLKDFSLFQSGKDWQGESVSKLELRKIKSIYFVVSKSGSSNSSSGTFAVKELEVVNQESFMVSRENKLISSLSVIDNPFSPNGDGIKDKVNFVITLSQPAKVKLNVYSLGGDVIYEEDKGWLNAGENTFTWGGNKTNSSEIVRNGLYFYQIVADGVGVSDKISHLISVMK